MNIDSQIQDTTASGRAELPGVRPDPSDTRPVLLIPYVWIGDFVRCHTVVRALKQRWPNRPVDVLTTTLCAPLTDYMPGVRKGIVFDLPRSRLALKKQHDLANLLRAENYGSAIVLPRTWKSAIAPFLAGIPERTGFVGEVRFGLLNDWRWGEKSLPRFIDRCAMPALPAGAPLPKAWPAPQIVVPPSQIDAWRTQQGTGGRPAVTLAPGSVGSSKRWTYYPEAAKQLIDAGLDVWVIGGPGEKQIAAEIVAATGGRARDMTGTDLRNAILALGAAGAAVSNDSGLMHIAAAIGTPAIGIFGPTDPWHWAPLNPVSALIKTKTHVDCQPCHKPVCRMGHHRCMREIPVSDVVDAAHKALAHPDLKILAAAP